MKRQSLHLPVLAAFLLASVTSAQTSPPPTSDLRQPVPKFAEQSKAEHFLRVHYAALYAQHNPAGQLQLAHQMRDDLDQYTDDPARRFVILREARELAIDAGDLDYAFDCIDAMAKEFAVDPREQKASAMSVIIDKSSVPREALIDDYLNIADEQLDIGDIDLANKATTLASLLADQLRDPARQARVHQEHVAVMDGQREVQQIVAAANRLKLHPDNADDMLRVGKYVCFVRQLWEMGLPYLSRGSDETLSHLANAELAAQSPDATLAAADGWWTYADSQPGSTSRHIHLHAADLYRKAMPDLKDVEKDRAVRRGAQFPAVH